MVFTQYIVSDIPDVSELKQLIYEKVHKKLFFVIGDIKSLLVFLKNEVDAFLFVYQSKNETIPLCIVYEKNDFLNSQSIFNENTSFSEFTVIKTELENNEVIVKSILDNSVSEKDLTNAILNEISILWETAITRRK